MNSVNQKTVKGSVKYGKEFGHSFHTSIVNWGAVLGLKKHNELIIQQDPYLHSQMAQNSLLVR